ncbi:uncharacterized protein LOC143468110 [Clavelina lepadiformis]|uniref:uncharacterized protein LOC143468110 n=1 Tax=Clavelina lepadiformis TaxID=159417 RepID=UPI0040430FAB
MGSSSSAARKPRKKDFSRKDVANNQRPRRFPSRSSVKSCSEWFSNDDEVDALGFPTNERVKSVASILSRSTQGSPLNSKVATNKELDIKYKKLEREVEKLRKKVNELTLQISVATSQTIITKPQQPKKINPGQAITVDTGEGDERNLPGVGDHVVAMWSGSKWQYFTATIESFNKDKLKYTIEWDDHDPTGRQVDYFNLALDKVPTVDQIGVGSKVLFHQGQYKQQEVHGITRSGGLRWHEGEIERIYENPTGQKRYDGRHTKGEADGKWCTFKGYGRTFAGYSLEDFRMPPNVFDILSSAQTGSDNEEEEEEDEQSRLDVFVSYAKINCPSAIQAKEIEDDLPPSYEEAVVQSMCDPREIVRQLKAMGIKVFIQEDDGNSSLLEVVNAMKRVKVFIACLSDEYASSDRCRMEFQYAKKTLKIPVIPLVVGTGSFQWQMTVVGLLIAGELYIHFKNKEVQGAKMTELARAIRNNIPDLEIRNAQYAAIDGAQLPLHDEPGIGVTGKPLISEKADFFFSYCWFNSTDALEKKQIQECVGQKWSDPRLIVSKLASSTNMKSWLDIERLESAMGDGLGMFGQIASAMNECKFVVACISFEYASSDNCRMEFQFAAKSLNKPIVALIVGKGGLWKQTAVGKLIQEGLPSVDFQQVSNTSDMDEKIRELREKLSKVIEEGVPVLAGAVEPSAEKLKFRAPVLGDHVVCLHQRWAYFMATIDSFDEATMTYTVTWDDGDPTGREQSYKDVALDVTPSIEEIGIGTIVLFSQGSYGGTDGNNTGGARYHQGKVTNIYTDDDNVTRFDGNHTKGDLEEKWITYKGYDSRFTGRTIEDLRLSPNAMDALMAAKEAFNV